MMVLSLTIRQNPFWFFFRHNEIKKIRHACFLSSSYICYQAIRLSLTDPFRIAIVHKPNPWMTYSGEDFWLDLVLVWTQFLFQYIFQRYHVIFEMLVICNFYIGNYLFSLIWLHMIFSCRFLQRNIGAPWELCVKLVHALVL